jgi:hypothetical protein
MPVTFEQALDAFQKSGIDFTTADVTLCVERDVLPSESPLQAAKRKQGEREAQARLDSADGQEFKNKRAREARIASQFSALSGGFTTQLPNDAASDLLLRRG